MISGAARAEAAVLVIDAREGVQENSRRHGYLLGMLGIRQAVVCVNKMDLAGYERGVFERIQAEYSLFLEQVGIVPRHFIPSRARDGQNIADDRCGAMQCHGMSVRRCWRQLDGFEKEAPHINKPLRFPVQDVYKFTEHGDDRRNFAETHRDGHAAR